MQRESLQAAVRQRVADNLYRLKRQDGGVSFYATFREAGRQRQRKLRATTERHAIRECRALPADRDGGHRVTPANVTVRAFAESEWLPLIDSLAAAGRRSERGVGLDRDFWRLYVEPAIGDLRVGDAEGADVAAMLRGLRDRGLSETTCKNAVTVISAVYRLARSRRLVTRSPVDELDPGERPRPKVVERRRLDERSLAALVREAKDPYRIGVALLALTGMRTSEASPYGGATSITSSRRSTSAANSPELGRAGRPASRHARRSPSPTSR